MKKYHLIIIASFCLLLSACSYVTYFGDKLAPTTSIDVYYSAHDVTKQYKVIGHLNCTSGTQDWIKTQLINYAKKIGADAIVITGRTISGNGANSSGIVNADALKYTN